eukprot:scaffold438_cov250-Pinguiococcus_pyrenoidosus.AAC.32
MNTCPVPHTQREQVWLGIGAAVGAATAIAVRRIWSGTALLRLWVLSYVVPPPLKHLLLPCISTRAGHASPTTGYQRGCRIQVDALSAVRRLDGGTG